MGDSKVEMSSMGPRSFRLKPSVVSEAQDERANAEDELLRESVDFGEWFSALKSREIGKTKTPDHASLASQGFLLWLNPLIRQGWRGSSKGIDRADLPGLSNRYLTEKLYPVFQAEWDRLNAKHGKASFERALFGVPTIRRTLLFGSFFSVMQGLLTTVGRPIVLKILITKVEEGIDISQSIAYVTLFACVVFFEGWFGSLGRQLLSEEFGTQFQICANSAVYRKMLRIDTQKSFQDHSSEASLIGNDCIRAYENIRTASNLPMALAGVIGGVVVLLVMVGKTALVGMGIMFAILLLNVFMGKMTHSIEQKNLNAADMRLNLLQSVLEGIRAVKLFGWETKYYEKLTEIRDEECIHIRNYRLAHVFSIVSGRASPVLSSMATLVFFTLSGNELTIAIAYATVSVFQALRLGLIFIPLCLTSLYAFDVTLKRLNAYFQRDEKPSPNYIENVVGENMIAELRNCDLGWSKLTTEKSDVVLRQVNLQVKPGEIVAVVGSVASGKSTLLASIVQAIMPVHLDEGEAGETGIARTCRNIGYAPQKPFVVCGTIKQNILLGRPYDEVRFHRVLEQSAFASDIAMFPNGVQTEVGERGTTLSGGQQARMAVARALYSDPDMLCLDDPLSAVDAKVCLHMFNRSILEHVAADDQSRRPKAVVVALNQLGYLPQVDKVVYLRDGKIFAFGTYEELLQSHKDFANFVATFRHTQDEENEEENQEKQPEDKIEIAGVVPHVIANENEIHFEEFQNNSDDEGAISQARSNRSSSSRSTWKIKPKEEAYILKEEARTTGGISSSVYLTYAKSLGYMFSFLCLLFCLSGYVVMAVNDFWLTKWAEALENPENAPHGPTFYAGVYATLSIAFGVLILTSSFMLCFGGVRASKSLHSNMLRRLLGAPMSWFESTASGRIISRFSGDLSKVDMILALSVDNLLQIIATLLVLLGVICYAVPFMTIIVVIAVILFFFLIVGVDRTSREVRRISNNAMSPLLSNASEATRGRDMVLVMNCAPFFEARHHLACDEYARANFAAGSLINYCVVGSQFLSFFISVFAATFLVVLYQHFPTDLIGLSLTYAFLVPYFMATTSQVLIRMNSFFTSFERLLEYEQLPQEIKYHDVPNEVDHDHDPPSFEWPTKGQIVFQNVCMRYRPELPLVLKSINFTIPSESTVGILGKTGSGKSSTIACLFRTVEIESGNILIDGRDIASIHLDTLRSRMTIIPQDPVLMKGSIRNNLDPFDEYTETELMEALDMVGFGGGKVKLDDPVDAGGRNWSCGERQLICFGRAFLRRSKILICDEPTSSIDATTDQFIQEMVREQFHRIRKTTIVTIAHRLNTIADFQHILVLGDGQVQEMDTPRNLLSNPNSEFTSMVEALGEVSRQKIYQQIMGSK